MKKYLVILLSLGFVVACGREYDTIDSEFEAKKETRKEVSKEVKKETVKEVKTRVNVPDKVYFDLNKSDLKSEGRRTLDTASRWLLDNPEIKIVVEGYCDERGTREYNIALGKRRAESTKRYLVSKGVSASRIKTISYGKERPEFLGKGEEIWAKNRRAVVVISKSK
jgi:peptidoglycan-associated lipoprotein